MKNGFQNAFMFKPAPDLGQPDITLPKRPDKVPVALQFLINGLSLGESSKNILIDIAKNCLEDIVDIKIEKRRSRETNELATLVAFGFYIDRLAKEEDHEYVKVINNKSRGLIEKYVGILSFFAGVKLSVIFPQFTIMSPTGFKKILPPIGRGESKLDIDFLKAKELCGHGILSDKTFSALFWLRRGIAERDPIETFSALTVCLQILAFELVPEEPQPNKCPHCKNELPKNPYPITFKFLKLLTTKLGAPPKLARRIWKLRSAIIAHGGKTPLDADTFIELTELKFEAAKLAFKGIGLMLNLDPKSLPMPHQQFFVTDALMYLD